ncbi:DUF3558 domain-containing protein [Actinophytocola gossypii]|uniref:DUF3558 domain-containing protein n=1 Tax=Actinophytocola gossypii TaxID=2812003 RepID=A0ABT2JER1_9PSEU|nr:DUF3558 domain-containing protein [Actinophytocola gossypii]MCT2585925.1 hypothetical protein [Actinophytocola gossypii]
MRRTALIVTLAADLAVGLAGCSSEMPGSASPTEDDGGGNAPSFPEGTSTGEETTEPSGAKSDSVDLDPCELLSSADLTALGLPTEPFGSGEVGPGRSCGGRLRVSPSPGSDHAVKVSGARGACVTAIAVTDSSRVDVNGLTGGDMTKVCEYAQRAAEPIEPRLPVIAGTRQVRISSEPGLPNTPLGTVRG